MSGKKKTPAAKSARGVTENTTGVFRMPVSVKEAIAREAKADGVKPCVIVRQALARELAARGYKLTAETQLACHVE